MSAYSAAGDVVDNSEPTSAPGITTTTATSTDEPIMTPRDVEELFESSNQQEAQLSTYRRQDEEDEEENISNEENSWRVEQLSRVLSTLSKLLDSGSTELDTVVQKVGDGSRDRESI